MDEQTKKEIAEEVTRQVLSSIKQEVIPAVEQSIKVTVNGKIDRLTVAVADIHKRLDEQDIQMAPVIETMATMRSGRKFLIWVMPVLAAVGASLTFIKKVL